MQLSDFALNPVSPLFSAIFASLGCLLGIVLAARARRYTGWRRVVNLAYATVSVAGSGLWQPALISVVGLAVKGSVVRLEPVALGASLATAVVTTAVALVLLCDGGASVWRVYGAAVLLAAGVTGSGLLMVAAVVTGGPIGYRPVPGSAALAFAITTGIALAWALGMTRTLRSAVTSAAALGVMVTIMQVVTTLALQVRTDADAVAADDLPGLSPLRVGVPAAVLGAVFTALLYYFGVGPATRRDLRRSFVAQSDADDIEPWMIEQVQARVALSSTAYAPASAWSGNVWADATVAVHVISLSDAPVVSAFAPVRDDPDRRLVAATVSAQSDRDRLVTVSAQADPDRLVTVSAQDDPDRRPWTEVAEPDEIGRLDDTGAWQPVPGWRPARRPTTGTAPAMPAVAMPAVAMPAVAMPAVATPAPVMSASATAGNVGATRRNNGDAVGRIPRPTQHWDQPDREHNEARVAPVGRSTNSRHRRLPGRPPRPVPAPAAPSPVEDDTPAQPRRGPRHARVES